MIFCMERKHADRIRDRFSAELAQKPLITLRIPDTYAFMDPVLIDLLRTELGPHLEL